MMKKVSLILGLVLVLALSVSAGAQWSLSGFVQVDAGIRQPWDPDKNDGEGGWGDFEFFGQGRRRALLTFANKTKNQGNLKLTVTFGNTSTDNHGADDWFDWSGDVYSPGNKNAVLNMSGAKIEASGAWWKDGPAVTTILGKHNAGYSKWVANNNRRRPGDDKGDPQNSFLNAVEVKGLNVGPVALSVIHGYAIANGDWGQDKPTFINAKADLGGINTSVTAVNREVVHLEKDAERDKVWDFAIEADTTPMDGLKLSGAFAVDGQGQGRWGRDSADPKKIEPKYAYQLDAELTTIPDVKLTASTWKAEDGFAPRYAQWNKDAEGNDGTDKGGNYVPFKTNRQGFKVGAETTQDGVTLNGSYSSVRNVSDLSSSVAAVGKDQPPAVGTQLPDKFARTELSAGAKTTVQGYDLSVSVTLADQNRNDDKEKTTTTKFGVGTKLGEFDLKYDATFVTTDPVEEGKKPTTERKHVVSATTTQDVFFADGVKFNVTVKHDEIDGRKDKDGNTILEYGADATYTAPNGMNVVIGYANYNKSGNNFVNKKNPDGFYIRTHMQINF